MAVVIVGGLVREVLGDLPHYDPTTAVGAFPVGEGSPLLAVGAVYILMKSFANGGSSLTGLEAISNGVSTFRAPQGLNARRTLVIMSALLGTLVAGVSWLAHETHAVAYESGSPTVISQVAKAVLGDSVAGQGMYFVVQLATMLILWTGANTPFNGFPYLANFVAADGFLPRWLTKRGHRLAFSNGIIVLAVIALALILGTGAHVDELVAFYAIGVFTGSRSRGSAWPGTSRRTGWAGGGSRSSSTPPSAPWPARSSSSSPSRSSPRAPGWSCSCSRSWWSCCCGCAGRTGRRPRCSRRCPTARSPCCEPATR
jgi:hypothetical protein